MTFPFKLMAQGEYWGRTISSRSQHGILLTLVQYEPGATPMHVHEHPGLFFLLRGQHRQSSASGEFDQRVLTGLYHGTTDAHETQVGPQGMLGLNISFNKGFSERIDLEDSGWARTPVDHQHLALFGLRLAQATQMHANPDNLSNLAVEAISCLDDRKDPLCKTVRRIRSRIDDEFSDSIRITELALDEGIHPVYLARAFRKGFGCSITEYLQKRRLAKALTLVQEGSSIGEAAAASGFADQSHLNRICRKHLGVPPGQLRQNFFPLEV